MSKPEDIVQAATEAAAKTLSATERFGPRGGVHKPKERFTSWMVPAALGHGYDTEFGVWMTITGRKPPPEGTKEMERGTVLEDVLLKWGADHLGMQMEPSEYRRDANGWSGDFVDCLYVDKSTGELQGVVEAKTVAQGAAEKWGHPGTDDIPLGAFLQCQWHLLHYPEVDRVFVPALFGGYRFHFEMYEVRRDPEVCERVLAEAQAWWEKYVVLDVAPPYSAGDTDWLNSRYACAPESIAEITEAMQEAVAVRLKYEPIRNKADKLMQAANNRIREAMGSAHRAKTDLFSISWGAQPKAEKIDYAAVLDDVCQAHGIDKSARAALLEKHTTVVLQARRLTVTGRGDWKVKK